MILYRSFHGSTWIAHLMLQRMRAEYGSLPQIKGIEAFKIFVSDSSRHAKRMGCSDSKRRCPGRIEKE